MGELLGLFSAFQLFLQRHEEANVLVGLICNKAVLIEDGRHSLRRRQICLDLSGQQAVLHFLFSS
jgi:hypothetical protein